MEINACSTIADAGSTPAAGSTFIELECGVHEALRLMAPCPVCARADEELAVELAQPLVSRWSMKHETGEVMPYAQRTKEEDMGTWKHDEAARQKAVERFRGGESADDIGASMGVSGNSVRNWAKSSGESTPAPKTAPKKAAPKKPAPKASSRPMPIDDEPEPEPEPESEAAHEADDVVNRPAHYTSSPSGVECIEVIEHMPFCRGNAIKYLWRAGQKGDELEDLAKARWYVDREIRRVERARGGA